MSRSASVLRIHRYVSEERMKGAGFQGLVIEFLEIIFKLVPGFHDVCFNFGMEDLLGFLSQVLIHPNSDKRKPGFDIRV
jgi:hypothetical protein